MTENERDFWMEGWTDSYRRGVSRNHEGMTEEQRTEYDAGFDNGLSTFERGE